MLVGSAVRRVAIVGGLRIPFARSYGAYATASNQDMLTAAFRAVVERFKLQGERLGDVAAGAVLKHSRDYNLVRESVLSSGLDPHTPGLDMQRACGTSLEATIDIGNKIALGQIEAGLAGGTDSISDAPLAYPRAYQQLLLASYRGRNAWQRLSPWLGLRPRHFKPVLPAVVEPRTGLSMGQSTEIMAKRWQIGRAEQDQLAQHSHLNAAAAWRSGFYDDLVVEYLGLKSDNNVRADSSAEKLARLRPSFAADGTLTAGNSTPLTDGASAVLLATPEWAAKRKLPVLAYLRYGKAWAVDFAGGKEGVLMAPTYAVPAMLVVFCRRPRLGAAKSRLAHALGAAQALAIAQALLECALEDARAWPGALVIAPENPAEAPWAQGLLERAATVQPQPRGNLGERLNAVDAAVRAAGHERVLFIGSDAPSLTVSDLLAGHTALDTADVVLAPARDGGVTLMGSRLPWPDLAPLPWSEPTLGAALEQCCRSHARSVTRLPGSYDIDAASDLPTARRALAADDRPARRRLHELLVRNA